MSFVSVGGANLQPSRLHGLPFNRTFTVPLCVALIGLISILALVGCKTGKVVALCANDSDCEKGYVCLEQKCRQPCNTTQDCTGTDYICVGGVCAPGCHANEDCIAPGVCQTAQGATCSGLICKYQALPSGTACDDNDPCTDDFCDDQARCNGVEKVCDTPPAPSCLDGDTYQGFLALGQCDHQSGACQYEAFSLACPSCQTACLEPCLNLDCGKTAGGCGFGYCYPEGTPGCILDDRPNGLVCLLGTAPTGSCSNGLCLGCSSQLDCDDQNMCTLDVCLNNGSCQNTPRPNVVCDDGDYCTRNDRCDGAACSGTAFACSSCLSNSDCDDGNVCTLDICGEGGICFYSVSGVSACDDGDTCTINDTCLSSYCAGEYFSCDDGDLCTVDLCNGDGTCSYSAVVGACDDGNLCTSGDVCGPSGCAGVTYSCEDNKICTANVCRGDGTCAFPPSPGQCNDNNPCTRNDTCANGACAGESFACTACENNSDCDDGNACTADVCSNKTCNSTNLTSACDDGKPCTSNDHCINGLCTGTAYSCNDSNICTNDTCVGDGSCNFTNNQNSCGTCKRCSGGNCGSLTAASGPGCDGACTNCIAGECQSRTQGDGTECSSGQWCCGPLPLTCQGSSATCPGAGMGFLNGYDQIRYARQIVTVPPLAALFAY